MAEEQLRVVQRVIGRLTALRMELDPEEQVLLDKLITGESPEVEAHAVTATILGRVKIDKETNEYRVVP